MKKRFIVFSLILALVLAASSSVYGLEVVGTTPKDGFTRSQPNNMAVKVKFDEQMVGAANIESNASHFKITDPEGKEQAFSMVYSEKYPNELWLILDEALQTDTEYKVTIGSGIVSASGNATTKTTTMSFRTRNTSKDNTISTIMMIGMMGLMVVMSVLSARKKDKEEQVLTVSQAEKLNPYKIAKQKKWSLEQAQAYV
ncbi:MAG: Ig-like domain-containing protein, partial [Firmicutes bacterium]|nr:Ig-like domain-containing protein [Bacillota bacterium]